jgi:NAD(P)H-nitrite reductase large subunit
MGCGSCRPEVKVLLEKALKITARGKNESVKTAFA